MWLLPYLSNFLSHTSNLPHTSQALRTLLSITLLSGLANTCWLSVDNPAFLTFATPHLLHLPSLLPASV